ncbi:hypothetical protein OAU52_00535 [bacterium]|nr:hypothetical protein [bacterium]
MPYWFEYTVLFLLGTLVFQVFLNTRGIGRSIISLLASLAALGVLIVGLLLGLNDFRGSSVGMREGRTITLPEDANMTQRVQIALDILTWKPVDTLADSTESKLVSTKKELKKIKKAVEEALPTKSNSTQKP